MDIIQIHQLQASAWIGVYSWEKEKAQPVWLDVQIFYERRADLGDNLANAINYDEVCCQLRAWITHFPCELIETLAEELCQRLLKTYPIQKVILTLYKPLAVAYAKNISLTIERLRTD